MFYKLILLAFTLCIFAVAHPVQQAGKTNIELNRRSAPTTEEGFIDQHKLLAHLSRTISKHQQNEINRQRNAQIQANSTNSNLNQSAAITIAPSPSHPSSAIHARQLPTEPVFSVDLQTAGVVWIGTNHQQVSVQFDTGSSDLWVMSPSCTSSACNGQPMYDPNQSPSVAFQSGSFSITYGDGTNIAGFLVSDVVVVAGVAAWNQWFSCATEVEINTSGISGILGLAYASLSTMHQTPYFINAANQKAISEAEFSLKLADPNPVLTLGGNDPSLYNGKLEFHPVETQSGYWKIGSASLFSGTDQFISGFSTVFDSGSAVSVFPTWAAQQFYSQLPGAQPSGNGFYTFPCDIALPSISISWANKQQWNLPRSALVLGQLSSGLCEGAVAGMDLNLGGDADAFLIGTPILEAFYIAFNYGNNAIGVASLK